VTGESKGLLIEESRTNRETASTGTVSYVGQGSQRTNAAVAPDGTLTALECIPNTISTTHVFDQYGNPVLGDMTFSLFVKANGYHKCLLEYTALGSGTIISRFDLSTGTVTSNTNSAGKIQEIGNGWYRISMSFDCGQTAANIQRFQILDDNGNSNFAGDGFSGMFIWGYQFEQGAFPTSYIPTSGSTVTRATDVFNLPMSGIYSSGPVTMFYEAAEFDVVDYSRMMLLSDGTNNNRMQINPNNTSSLVQSYVVTNGNIEGAADLSYNVIPNQFYKAASAFATGDNAVSAGGLTPATNTPDTLPQVTNLYLGSLHGADADKGGWFKKVALYPTRLSNATLQAMTEE
jgi:hypothetical protein